MTARRLETQIKKLCEEALKEQRALEPLFRDLRAALREHNELVEKLAELRFPPAYKPAVSDLPSRKRLGQ